MNYTARDDNLASNLYSSQSFRGLSTFGHHQDATLDQFHNL
jgi:hypothetical protein